jgi:hypothetical protein
MSKEQLIDLADESGRNLENGKSQITSLEADQRKLVSLLLRLTKITGSLRNRLFELSMDNKALMNLLRSALPTYMRYSPICVAVPKIVPPWQIFQAFES